MTEIIKLVLTNCVQISPLKKTNPEITVAQLRREMKVWREGTTTSPSGRHLEHYKSLFMVIDKSLEYDERKELKEIQERIAGCYVAILNYVIQHNYSYKRRKQILNFMIYKEQGNVKIHQLQVVHIYEVDYNFLIGAVQREAIQQAQKLGKINQGQYGGCPGRDCTSVTYLEELRRDISILTRSAYTNFNNGAASCYNRILMSVASLSGRKYEVHKKVVYVHAATLKEAGYKLKLSSKTSNTSYRHCEKFPIHGTSQGSGNSPMIWCFISSILFDCHNQKAHGLTTASPNGDVVVSFSIISFINDSTCVTGDKLGETVNQLLARVKHDPQLWHDLLWASRGKLELQKCGFHLIFYNFDKDGVPSMNKIGDLVITLENEKGEDIEIRTKKIDEARKNLGHWKEPKEIKNPK